VFRFKQFSVDQTGCAMKINTDGVLLGALAEGDVPASILDIGTGTGVIALMLAQRYAEAVIDAVEIDPSAAEMAGQNFKNSIFHERLNIYSGNINEFFDRHPENKYDLIISNPPFYINSLQSPAKKKSLAKHTEANFFEMLVKDVFRHLSEDGCCWLILPIDTASLVEELIRQNGMCLSKTINVHSYSHSVAHRVILYFGFNKVSHQTSKFTIYKETGIYSEEYRELLKPYFIAF
jgi:tRNA1Val (adenine37-N6)-methyltransferase